MAHDHVVDIDLAKEYAQKEQDQAAQYPHHHQTQPSIPATTTTTTPEPQHSSSYKAQEPALPAGPRRSCLVCRKTLLMSYFNCCAICLGVIECGRLQKHSPAADSLPIVQPPPSPSLPPPPPPSPSPSSPVSAAAHPLTHISSASSSSSTTSSTTAVNSESNAECQQTDDKPSPPPPSSPPPPPHCDSSYCRYTHARPLMLFFVLCELVPSLGGLALANAALYRRDWTLLRFAGLLIVQWWQIFVLPRQWHCGHPIITGQLAACLFMVWFYVEGSTQWHWWEPLAISTVLLKIVFPW
ncbi:hypothetical protein AAE478_003500 [Parahypoxylon ruwenzoriense]